MKKLNVGLEYFIINVLINRLSSTIFYQDGKRLLQFNVDQHRLETNQKYLYTDLLHKYFRIILND